MFPDLTKTFNFGFFAHRSSEVFKILQDYKRSWGLPVHTRYDNLDRVSQVCQNHKLLIDFCPL